MRLNRTKCKKRVTIARNFFSKPQGDCETERERVNESGGGEVGLGHKQ